MNFEFSCPWCGADTTVRGSQDGSWRFRIPCELCDRDMVVTWNGELEISRAQAAGPLMHSADATVRIRIAKSR